MNIKPDPSSRKKLLYGSGSAAAVLIVLAILVFLALLAERYPWRLDLTADKSQSLSIITKNKLAEVKEPLKLTAFLPEGQSDRQAAKEVLDSYQYQNRQLSVRIVDPERQPLEAQQAGYRQPGNVLLEYQGRRQLANAATEENLTNAIRKLLHPQSKKVYFLTGHGERGLKESERGNFHVARQSLTNEGIEVQDLNLLTQSQVPTDASVLILAGPVRPLFASEIKAIENYLQRGGRVLVLLEPYKDAGLEEFLTGYGLELDNRLILDDNQVSRALGASITMPLVIQYGNHRITQDFSNVVTIFPLARPLYLAKEPPQGVHLFPLANTTSTSWAIAGQERLKSGKAEFNQQTDRKGPFTLAALVEKRLSAKAPGGKPESEKPGTAAEKPDTPNPALEKIAYLIVIGNTDFADSRYFNLSGNGDLFLNTVNFLAGEETQIAIRSEEKKAKPLILTGYQGWSLFLVCLVLIPLAVIIAGVNAYVRRRSRR
ncbi:GldG family protein [Desulfobacca acetoxidans]|uniref:ABC-type uncharacterized transport system n=1 Tax=Desulfobacca acetoxidans (strain ATCC 700848 / DSM 11109 / ASRB2) TaxID=880072 RepID=F2NGM4_DESAR|nr:Gldg family protein [Desulfobacca acetoxidans]AEB07931.1 ABC-type uncharacterized transport system [Desulfobacca acetoxidans DSM 11109]